MRPKYIERDGIMQNEYESLLKAAMQKLPKKEEEKKRFEVPQATSFVQGNKTIVKNFSEIASRLRREGRHVSKFLCKQLAAPGSVDGETLVLQSKLQNSFIQRKIEDYIKEYVYCKVCGEPDTVLVKDGRITSMKCEACGARSSVREI